MQQKQIDVLVVAAMQEELSEICTRMDNAKKVEVTAFEAYYGTVKDKSVVAILSGVGKINAALTTTFFVNQYKPSYVINVGSAGGLHEEQHVGDVVLSTRVLSHDFDIGPNTPTDLRFQYEADHDLIEVAEKILTLQGKTHYKGLVVSGDQFVVNGSYAYNRIKTLYADAICAEMEATAVGAVCTRFNIPFLIVRALSDVPFYKNNDQTFEEFLVLASQESATFCIEIIKKVR